MRARLAELAGSPRQAAAAAAAGAADRASRMPTPHRRTTAHPPPHRQPPPHRATAHPPPPHRPAPPQPPAAAAATAAAPLRVLQAELRRSGGFAIVDEEFGQDDVGEFFLSEGDYGKRLLRRCLLTVHNGGGRAARHRQGHSRGPPHRQGRFRTFSLRSLLRARHGGSLPYSLKTTQRRYVSTSWTTVSPEEKSHRSGIGVE